MVVVIVIMVMIDMDIRWWVMVVLMLIRNWLTHQGWVNIRVLEVLL